MASRLLAIIAIAVIFCSATVFGHGWQTRPAPRIAQDSNPTGPCDQKGTNSPQPTQVTAGTPFSVDWIRPHLPGGNVQIAVAPAGSDTTQTDFTILTTVKYSDTGVSVTLPKGTVGAQTLQWYQDSPGPYYNCADLTVLAQAPEGATPVDGSTTLFQISHGQFDASTGETTCDKGYKAKTNSDGDTRCTKGGMSGGAIFGILLLVVVLVGLVGFAGTMIFLKVKKPETYDNVVGKMKSGATKTKEKTVQLAVKVKAKATKTPSPA